MQVVLKILSFLQPLVADPQERKNAFCKPGQYGDSMFARKDFKAGELILYLGGMINRFLDLTNLTVKERYVPAF